MDTTQLTSHKLRKSYIAPRCEEIGNEVNPLLAVMSVPYDTTNQWNGEFDARESGEFFDDDEGDDYDY